MLRSLISLSSAPRCFTRRATLSRYLSTSPRRFSNDAESTNINHAQFLATASPSSDWKKTSNGGQKDPVGDELEGVEEGVGKLLPTSSHLFKLILPLDGLSRNPSNISTSQTHSDTKTKPKSVPTVLLLHPSQPLSHVSRLILASLAPETPSISFRSSLSPSSQKGFQWSDSTDVGDFIRDAARTTKFSICVTYDGSSTSGSFADAQNETSKAPPAKSDMPIERSISIRVPTFLDRTRYLRRRLEAIKRSLASMEDLKHQCDREARRGARRMAVGGFGLLVVYWAAVARLTFWDYGWDVMEPITYLSGLSTVICGYLWFLYQGREVSYSSVLDRSISSRREALYKARGLDIEKWMDLVTERKAALKEIGRIKEDYEEKDDKKDKEDKEDEEEHDEDDDGEEGRDEKDERKR